MLYKPFDPTRLNEKVTSCNFKSFKSQVPCYADRPDYEINSYIGNYIVRFCDLNGDVKTYITHFVVDDDDEDKYLFTNFWYWRMLMLKRHGWTHLPSLQASAGLTGYILKKYKKLIKKANLL